MKRVKCQNLISFSLIALGWQIEKSLDSVPSPPNLTNNFLGILPKTIRDALRDLVPFVQFKKREKHPWSSVNFNTVACF